MRLETERPKQWLKSVDQWLNHPNEDDLARLEDLIRFGLAPHLPEPLSAWAALKFEHGKIHSRDHHFYSMLPMEALAHWKGIRINGELPKEGPFILVASHTRSEEPIFIHWTAIRKARRTIRTFCKRKLVEPFAQETEEAKTGRTTHDALDFQPPKHLAELLNPRRLIEVIYGGYLAPAYIKGFGPYPVDLRNPNSRSNLKSFKEADRNLKNGHGVCFCLQGHRRPDFDLLEVMDGAARLAKRNPDVSIYSLGFSYQDRNFSLKDLQINIGPDFTYREIPQREGMDEIVNATEFMAAKIAEQIGKPELIPAWWARNKLGLTGPQIGAIYYHNPEAFAFTIAALEEASIRTFEEAKQFIQEEIDPYIFA